MRPTHPIPTVPLLVGLLALGACGEGSTEPYPGLPPGFDPHATAAALAEMASVQNELGDAWAGVTLSGGLLEAAAVFDLLPDPSGRLVPDPGTALEYLDELDVLPFFPSGLAGRALVWDGTAGEYVATDTLDVPDEAIRVHYYAFDPATNLPADPLDARGYVELRNLSDAYEAVGVRVVRTAGSGPETLADYEVEAALEIGGSHLTMAFESRGSLNVAGRTLDFALRHDVTHEQEVTYLQDFEMTVDGATTVRREAELAAPWGDPPAPSTARITASEPGAGFSIVQIQFDGESALGEVRYAGDLVARITGDAEDLTFTDPGGDPLEQGDRSGLEAMLVAADRVFAPGGTQ